MDTINSKHDPGKLIEDLEQYMKAFGSQSGNVSERIKVIRKLLLILINEGLPYSNDEFDVLQGTVCQMLHSYDTDGNNKETITDNLRKCMQRLDLCLKLLKNHYGIDNLHGASDSTHETKSKKRTEQADTVIAISDSESDSESIVIISSTVATKQHTVSSTLSSQQQCTTATVKCSAPSIKSPTEMSLIARAPLEVRLATQSEIIMGDATPTESSASSMSPQPGTSYGGKRPKTDYHYNFECHYDTDSSSIASSTPTSLSDVDTQGFLEITNSSYVRSCIFKAPRLMSDSVRYAGQGELLRHSRSPVGIVRPTSSPGNHALAVPSTGTSNWASTWNTATVARPSTNRLIDNPRSPVGVVRPTQSPGPPGALAVQHGISRLPFDRYPTKDHTRPQGRGFVLILANFIEDLVGYKTDVQAITHFFKIILQYDVYGGSDTHPSELPKYRDLSRDRMLSILHEVQSLMNNTFTTTYDRLFIFILSHGDETGIRTCRRTDSGAIENETDVYNNRPICVKTEEIVAMFYHDKAKSLRGYPKCFFIQTCRGNQNLQAAADTMPVAINAPIPLGADTAVFYASNYGHPSYVSRTKGSWFIQEFIAAVTQYHGEIHLLDIMTEVTNIVSKKSDEIQGQTVPAYQLPTIVSNLTKSFYLCNIN